MTNECVQIINISIPQMNDDVEIVALITKVLNRFGFQYLDMTVSMETDKIDYSFQRIQADVYES